MNGANPIQAFSGKPSNNNIADPRKFLQIRVNIVSDDPFKTGRVRQVQVDLAPPLLSNWRVNWL